MGAELIHALVAVGTPARRTAILESLPGERGFSVEVVEAEDVRAVERDRFDVAVVELAGDADAPDLIDLVRARLPRAAIIAIAGDPGLRRRAERDCADCLDPSEVLPAVVERVVRHAVRTVRSDRRHDVVERALAASEQRYQSLFDQSRDALFIGDPDAVLLEVNEAATTLLGRSAEDLLGLPLAELFADAAEGERVAADVRNRGVVHDAELRVRRPGGDERWCLVSAWLLKDAEGSAVGCQGILHDITERKRVERRLEHEAFHDALTGLPNRVLFMDRLERATARRKRAAERDLALLFLDVDRFKTVNDRFGHPVGDDLLRKIGSLLEDEVRTEDTVARLGGDEFAVLLDGVDDASDATHVAERIQQRLRRPFHLRGHDVFASVSIGITFGGPDAESPEALLHDADAAMYRAKTQGPARYQIFDEAMHAHAVSVLQLETDLRLALERGEFVVHYQPIFDADGGADDGPGRLAGFEALVRWDHPTRGLIPPQAFLPVAEDTGLIVGLGEWVLRQACAQLRLWKGSDPARRELFVSVNISGRQFRQPELADAVGEAVHETGLEPASLQLEVNETVLMDPGEAAVDTLRRLRELGVGVCIDDFGAGYSSLPNLHDLPVRALKVDRGHVGRIGDPSGRDVVSTILTLADRIGVRTVAVGVETEDQLEALRGMGTDFVQGYYLGRPLDEGGAGALLEEAPGPSGQG